MYRYTIPFNDKKVTIITIGTSSDPPSHQEMNLARNWVDKHKDQFPKNIDNLKSILNREVKLEIFNHGFKNKEYVLLIETEIQISDTDLHNYEQVTKCIMDDNDDEILLFVYGTMKMSRINKDLINFF